MADATWRLLAERGGWALMEKDGALALGRRRWGYLVYIYGMAVTSGVVLLQAPRLDAGNILTALSVALGIAALGAWAHACALDTRYYQPELTFDRRASVLLDAKRRLVAGFDDIDIVHLDDGDTNSLEMRAPSMHVRAFAGPTTDRKLPEIAWALHNHGLRTWAPQDGRAPYRAVS
jgi:hypothetical protein